MLRIISELERFFIKTFPPRRLFDPPLLDKLTSEDLTENIIQQILSKNKLFWRYKIQRKTVGIGGQDGNRTRKVVGVKSPLCTNALPEKQKLSVKGLYKTIIKIGLKSV